MNWQELKLDNIRAELAENLRLRIGLWLCLAIVLCWLSLVWSDFNAATYKDVRALQQEYVSLSEIESVEVWTQRRDDVASLQNAMAAKLWQAESESLARAKLQATMATLAKSDISQKQAISVGTPQLLVDAPGISQVRARVGVSVSPNGLHALLQRIDRAETLIAVDQLTLKLVRGQWNVELMISAFFDATEWTAS